MINKPKLAFIAALALASIASASLPSPGFAWTRTAHHRHHLYNYAPNQPLYNSPDAGNGPPSGKPVDNPALTGGGSWGYNQCAGHPTC